jgi:hypothetical protein
VNALYYRKIECRMSLEVSLDGGQQKLDIGAGGLFYVFVVMTARAKAT